jgi:hypothetical protein
VTTGPSGGLFYSRDATAAVEEAQLTYSNPHGQRVGPRWVRGEIVFAMPLGIVNVDPATTRWAKEYVVVYSIDGGPEGRAERVPGQFGIYDSKPGDDNYSPIWRYNYVVVPRDYEANSLRSEQDCLASGYPITESDTYTN